MKFLNSYKGCLDDDAFKQYVKQFRAIAPINAKSSEYKRRYNKRLYNAWMDYVKRPMHATKTFWELALAGYTARFWACKDRFEFFDYLDKALNRCITKGREAKTAHDKADLRETYKMIKVEIERLENYKDFISADTYEISEAVMDRILKWQLYI